MLSQAPAPIIPSPRRPTTSTSLSPLLTSPAVPVAGAIAGTAAAAAYIDAKYHLSKDIRGILGARANQKALEKNAAGKGQSLWNSVNILVELILR